MAAVERRIRVILEDNAPQYEAHMRGAASATQQFGQHAAKTEQSASLTGKAMSGMGSFVQQAAASFLGFASAQGVMNLVSSAVDFTKDTVLGFNDAMTQSTAIMGNVSDSVKNALGATARQVAVDYNTAVEDVAKGYYYLVSAGYDVESSQLAIGQVTAFAKAGMFDLERATELAADAQNAMGLKSDDAGENLRQLTRVTDVLTKANIDANGSVEQFAEALTNKAAGASRLAGISLEETVGVLEAFAAQGVKGKRAGEDYAIVLRDLSTNARTNKSAFDALGITVYDTNGKFAGWSTIIGQVERALSGMSAEQKNATLATLGLGAESSAYLQVLLGTSGAIDRYTQGVRNAGGATQQVAERQMQSMVEQLKHIRAQAAELGLKAFDGMVRAGQWMAEEFGPTIQNIGTLLSRLVNFVAPVAKAFAGIAGAAVVGGLMALARTLEGITGFFVQNEAAARALAVAGFAYLATQAAAATAALAELAYVQVGARLLYAAEAAGRMVTALQTSAAAGTLMTSTMNTASTAVRGLGSALTSTPAVILVAVAALASMKGWADGVRQSAEDMASAVAGPIDTGNMEQYSDALSRIDDKQNEIKANLNTYTSEWATFGSSLADLVIPFHDVENSAADLAQGLNALGRQKTEVIAKAKELRMGLYDIALGVMDAKGIVSGSVDEWATKIAQLAAANNIDLKRPWVEIQGPLQDAARRAYEMGPAAGQAAAAMQVLGDVTATADDKLKALKDTLDALIGVHVSAAQAENQFAGALDGLNGKLGAGIDLLDPYNERNRAARDAVLSAVDAATKHAVSVYEETGSLEAASGALESHRSRLVATMVQTGMTQAQAEAYIATLHLTPENIRTLVEADTARAQANVLGVQGQLGDVRQGANARVTADTSQGEAALANFNRQLDAINNRRVMAQVQAAPPQAPLAQGGVVKFYAGGGTEDHRAQILPGGTYRVWAEPETGGEAYIPLAGSKRDRSTAILGDVAGMFGYQLTPTGTGGGYQPGAVSAPVGTKTKGGVFAPSLSLVVNADVNADGRALAGAVVTAVRPMFDRFTRELVTEIRTR